jgi:hypothetical protein
MDSTYSTYSTYSTHARPTVQPHQEAATPETLCLSALARPPPVTSWRGQGGGNPQLPFQPIEQVTSDPALVGCGSEPQELRSATDASRGGWRSRGRDVHDDGDWWLAMMRSDGLRKRQINFSTIVPTCLYLGFASSSWHWDYWCPLHVQGSEKEGCLFGGRGARTQRRSSNIHLAFILTHQPAEGQIRRCHGMACHTT